MLSSLGPYMLPGAYVGDSAEMLSRVPDGSVHVSVSSPPYFKARVYHPDDPREIGREDDLDDYLRSLVFGVYAQVVRVMRDDGTIWVNLGDGFEKSSRRLMPFKFATLMMEELGLTLRMEVIMETTSISPEPVRVRPIPSHQYVFMFTKGSGHYYDPELALEPAPNEKGYRFLTSVWRMPASRVKQDQAAPYHVELPTRCILLSTPPGVCDSCGAPFKRVIERPLDEDGNKLPGFKEWAATQAEDSFGKYGKTAVRMADNSMGYGASLSRYFKEVHGGNTTKRTIRGFGPTCECGDVDRPGKAIVLDPFLGTGTTAAAASMYGRSWIGFDIDPKLGERVAERMAELTPDNVAATLDMGFTVWDKLVEEAGLQGIVGSEYLPGWPDVFARNATEVDPDYLSVECETCGAGVHWTCDQTVDSSHCYSGVHRSRVGAGTAKVKWFRELVSAEYVHMRDLGWQSPGIGKSPNDDGEMPYIEFECASCLSEPGDYCTWLHEGKEGEEIPRGWGHLPRIFAAKTLVSGSK